MKIGTKVVVDGVPGVVTGKSGDSYRVFFKRGSVMYHEFVPFASIKETV